MPQEKRRMDSHETHLTGDEDIIITKTIRSVSGETISYMVFINTFYWTSSSHYLASS